ncbi:MAG: hypothetical protein NUV57_05590 [archaeon]|nr:hypothetical protein [archaeon]
MQKPKPVLVFTDKELDGIKSNLGFKQDPRDRAFTFLRIVAKMAGQRREKLGRPDLSRKDIAGQLMKNSKLSFLFTPETKMLVLHPKRLDRSDSADGFRKYVKEKPVAVTGRGTGNARFSSTSRRLG